MMIASDNPHETWRVCFLLFEFLILVVVLEVHTRSFPDDGGVMIMMDVRLEVDDDNISDVFMVKGHL